MKLAITFLRILTIAAITVDVGCRTPESPSKPGLANTPKRSVRAGQRADRNDSAAQARPDALQSAGPAPASVDPDGRHAEQAPSLPVAAVGPDPLPQQAVSATESPPGVQPVEVAGPREASVKPGINDEYKTTPIETWVERFETESREIYEQRSEIARALGLRAGESVADIGAGTGFFTELFSDAVGPAGQVYAVDITPGFLERIRTRAAEQGRTNVKTVLCKEDSVELAADSLDAAFICDTYHHFEYPKSTMTSVRRALRSGGRLMVVDFKRIPGVSREWVMNHVRAGQDEVTREITAAGFELIDEGTSFSWLLRENYLLRFRKPD